MRNKLAVVTPIKKPSQETVDTLRYLLSKAEEGALVGLALVAIYNGMDFDTAILGVAAMSPIVCKGMIVELREEAEILHR